MKGEILPEEENKLHNNEHLKQTASLKRKSAGVFSPLTAATMMPTAGLIWMTNQMTKTAATRKRTQTTIV